MRTLFATALGFLAIASFMLELAPLSGVPSPAGAAFPGQNGAIAFTSYRDGDAEVYVMNADGSGQTNLTNNPAVTDWYPAWSPDGSQILFVSFRDGDAEVYVMNADGSGQTNLTNNPADEAFGAWSPDGSQIAFTSNRDGDEEIYVMNADGSGQTNLTNNPTGDDQQPAWSPDGSQIAFNSSRDGTAEIYVMSANGSGQTNLTNNPADDASPDWSPDGTQITFDSVRDSNGEAYVMNADGSGQTNLTNNPADDWFPAWSPDGTQVAFESDRDGDFEIYVMNADGSGQTNLTNNPADDETPDWQPVVAVSASTETVAIGGSGEFTVDAEAPAGRLGVWSITVDYDASVITVTGCTAAEVGDFNDCNAAFVPGQTVRVAGASAGGLLGPVMLASFQFNAVGAESACTDLVVSVEAFETPYGTRVTPVVIDGQVCIQTPPAQLPTTGGQLSSASDVHPLALLAAFVVVAAATLIAGGWYARRRWVR